MQLSNFHFAQEINQTQSQPTKSKENAIYGRTIDFRAFFMTRYSMCKKWRGCRAGWRASGYLAGFSETAPHMSTHISVFGRIRIFEDQKGACVVAKKSSISSRSIGVPVAVAPALVMMTKTRRSTSWRSPTPTRECWFKMRDVLSIDMIRTENVLPWKDLLKALSPVLDAILV